MANFLKGRTNENLVKGHDVGATGIATGSTSERSSDRTQVIFRSILTIMF